MPQITPVQRMSAANRLRKEVLSVPGTVLLSQAGNPDQVIRFQHIPDCLKAFKKKDDDYIFLNLDFGPPQEAWATAQRDIYQTARRDRPIPNPVPVAIECKDEWSMGPEDVPLVENGIIIPTSTIPAPSAATEVVNPIIKCDLCTMSFNSEHALKIHVGRAHKK